MISDREPAHFYGVCKAVLEIAPDSHTREAIQVLRRRFTEIRGDSRTVIREEGRSTYTFSELLDIWMNGWAFHQDYPAEAETYDRLKAAVPDWFWFGVQSAVLPLTGVILDLDDLVADLLGKDRVPRIATRT